MAPISAIRPDCSNLLYRWYIMSATLKDHERDVDPTSPKNIAINMSMMFKVSMFDFSGEEHKVGTVCPENCTRGSI